MPRGAPTSLPLRALPLVPGDHVPSPFLRARSAAQLLQHSPLAEIVPFNEHTETAFRPRFFICIFADGANHAGSRLQVVATVAAAAVKIPGSQTLKAATVAFLTGPLDLPVVRRLL